MVSPMIALRLIGLVLDLLFLPIRLFGFGKRVPRGTWLSVTIDGPVVDIVPPARFWRVRAQKSVSVYVLDEVVTAMLADSRVTGLVVTLRAMSAGMAMASSLRAVLAKARAGGKRVVVYLPMGGDTKEVYVATVADKIVLGPAAQLAPLGFRVTARYLKRALDRAGVTPEVFACGEFKSAGESLVRESMSAPQRAQLERLIESFHDALLDAIASGRKVGRERASALVDGAPYFGQEAITQGLADEIAYEDELPAKLGIEGGRKKLRDAGAYLARMKRPLVRGIVAPPVVAVVPVHGPIAHASGPFGGLSTDERLARTIRLVRRDSRVRGVILHVDSPGGSALASDLMCHEIEQLAREKPVVACMANVAASGGYYVAAPAARIVAHPMTVTGSIGVVAARLSMEPLLDRLGITTEFVAKGKRSALLSAVGPLDEDDKAAVDRELAATYRCFVGVVAKGRKMPEAQVEPLARGRVYTGKDAYDVKLVDALGGFDTALEELRKLLPANVRDRVVVGLAKTPRHSLPPLEPPTPDDLSKKAARSILGALLDDQERAVFHLVTSGERILALAPIVVT
jgi:protease-4